jgi:hypothetical protein
MGLFDFFKSDEEKLRSKIRSLFDDCVKKEIKENRDMIKDPLFGGIMIQTAIESLYTSLRDAPAFLLAELNGGYQRKILEEEYERALKKYLKL